jgi:MYXO-CTERM domain-containing protein
VSARQVRAVAWLTVREAARRRVLWVLLALALGSVTIVGWGVDQLVSIARERGVLSVQVDLAVSQVLILIAFLFSFVLATSAAFLGAPAIAGDIENGTLLAMLARPTSRADVLLGRWLGLALVIACYALLCGGLALLVVERVSGYLPPLPASALAYLAGEALVVLTLAVALGTRLPGIAAGAVAVGLFGLSWFGGVLHSVAVLFEAEAIRPAADLIRAAVPTDLLWKGVIHALEPPGMGLVTARGGLGAEANPFYAASPPPPEHVAWALAWLGLVLLGGLLLFRRREV